MATAESVKQLNADAVLAMKAGDTARAKSLLDEAFGTLHSPDHSIPPTMVPELLGATHNNLGCLAKREKHFSAALKHLTESVKLERAVRGKASPATLLNLSTVHSAMGHTQKAVELAEACVNNVPPSQSQMRVTALHNLAMAELALGGRTARDLARAHLSKALEEALNGLGRDHATTKIIRQRIESIGGGATGGHHLGKDHSGSGGNNNGTSSSIVPLADRDAAAKAMNSLQVPSPVRCRAQGGDPDGVMRGATFDNGSGDQLPKKTESTDGSMLPPIRSSGNNLFNAISNQQGSKPSSSHSSARPGSQSLQQHEGSGRASTAGAADGTSSAGLIGRGDSTSLRNTPQNADGAQPRRSRKHSPSAAMTARLERAKRHQERMARHGVNGMPPLYAASSPNRPTDGGGASRPDSARSNSSAALLLDEPRFVRFATDIRDKAPPLPISFRDVKDELKALDAINRKALDQQQRDQHHRSHRSGGGGIGGADDGHSNPFHGALDKRVAKMKYEQKEEEAFLQFRRKQREKQEREEERKRRAEVIEYSRRNHAALKIQRVYRKWRLSNKARLDARAVMQQKEIAASAKKATGFANKWLNKTAGRRFVSRMRTAHDPAVVDNACRTIQRFFRNRVAVIRRQKRQVARRISEETRVAVERRAFAAIIIQTWFRRIRCMRIRKSLHSLKYVKFCVILQRWIRNIFQKQLVATVKIGTRRRQTNAATKIQSAWRAYAARVRVAMVRLQQKVRRMKHRELQAVKTMQRIGRGGIVRQLLVAPYHEQVAARHRRTSSRPLVWTPLNEQRQASPPNLTQRLAEAPVPPKPKYSFEEESRDTYIDVVVEEQAKRIRNEHSQFGSQKQYDRTWGAEQLKREKEFKGAKMVKAARVVQRAFRRWRKLRDPIKFAAVRNNFRHKHEMAQLEKENEKLHRARMRSTVKDIAGPIRNERVSLQRELAGLEREHGAGEGVDYVYERRSMEEKAKAREELKALKALMRRDREIQNAKLDNTY